METILSDAVRDPAAGEPAEGWYASCPLRGCPWMLRLTTAEHARRLVSGEFASLDDLAAATVWAGRVRDDARVRVHLQDAHVLEDFVETILGLQAELADTRAVLSRVAGVHGSLAAGPTE